MKTSQNGINLIKQFEGCRLKAYRCPAGVWTIGYGHTAGVKEGQVISQAQADAYLSDDLAKYERMVGKYDSKYAWSQNQFDALVSFAYNVGNIDQLTAKGTRTKDEIADKMLEYNKVNSQISNGLMRRRNAERGLFITFCTSLARDGAKRSTVKPGSSGADVLYLQKRLTAKGYGVGAIDGKFGNKTLEAVKAFQAENNLAADGVVGAKTWEVLG